MVCQIPMKYFTVDQWIADQEPEPSVDARESALIRYADYLRGARSALPIEFLPLTSEIVIHDARALSVTTRVQESTVEITLDPGPLTGRPWRELHLTYLAIRTMRLSSDPDKGLVGPNGFGDLGYDEIEVLDGGMFEHRLLFSSGIELAIMFEEFRLEVFYRDSVSTS